MNEADRILVVIPVYNCAAQISRVLAQFSEPSVAAFFSEILVIDNGSRDNTREAAIGKAKSWRSAELPLRAIKGIMGLAVAQVSFFICVQWCLQPYCSPPRRRSGPHPRPGSSAEERRSSPVRLLPWFAFR